MAATEVLTTGMTEEARVLAWRLEELERAGYDRAAAWDIAERGDIDLHAAMALLRKGCPSGTALRILL